MRDRPSKIIATDVTANGQTLFTLDNAAALDGNGYDWVTVQSTGTFVATIIFEVSNDGTNWLAISNLYDLTSKTAAASTITVTGKMYFIPLITRFIRARSTAYTSGTASLKVIGGYGPSIYNIPTDTQAVSGTVTATVASTALAPSSTVGGFTTFSHIVSAATTNATSVKATAGTLGKMILTNTSASMKFVKIYNKASAPTVGTDTPVMTIGVPATSVINALDNAAGLRLTTGIAFAITGGVANNDTTAVALNDVVVDIEYM